jgi:uncharacterized protein (TIGR02466 family)
MAFERDEGALNAELAAHFMGEPRYWARDQAEKSDTLNLADLAEETPAFARLRELFESGLRAYCRTVGWAGEFELALQMFPNVAPAGHYVPAHNHVADVAGVYYVQTPVFENRPVVETGAPISEYWRQEEGVLILLDPRFNASLGGAWQHFARVYPRPGLMILFPAFLWHEVTPHFSDAPRLSVAANFTLRRRAAAEFERRSPFAV